MFWNKTDALELIELTYALMDDENGCQNFFEHIETLFGEAKFALQMWDDSIKVDDDRIILRGWDASSVTAYVDHYASINPFLPLISQRSSGAVYHLHDLITPDAFASSEFLNDFQYLNGNVAGVTATILKEKTRSGALSVDGPAHNKQHWDELVALLKIITPHLQRVMRLSRQFQEVSLYRSIANLSMDRVAASMIVVDAIGRVKFANSSAMDVLSEGKVLKTGASDYIQTSTYNQTQELLGLITSSTCGDTIDASSSGGYMMLNTHNGKQMLAMIAPLGRGFQKQMGLVEAWSLQKKYAVIFLTDPNLQVRLPSELLMMQFGLTKTEAALAVHIHAGGAIADYCDIRYVTLNTARTQLKTIFHKTGVTRQGELVALLNRMTAFAEMN